MSCLLSISAIFLFFPSLALSENSYRVPTQTEDSSYTCKIGNDCLNEIHNNFLDQNSGSSIYQSCRRTYQKSRECCINPSRCNEDFGREASQMLRQAISDISQLCRSHTSLAGSFSQAQNLICREGVNHCKKSCKKKLQEFKQKFRECFSIPQSLSISDVLEKAQGISNESDCYQEMIGVADKYRNQSLNQSSFRDDLRSEDIVHCGEIQQAKVGGHFQTLVLNVCHPAQNQKREEQVKADRANQLKPAPLEQAEAGSGQINSKQPAEQKLYGIEEWEKGQEEIKQEYEAIFGMNSRKDQELRSGLAQEAQKKYQKGSDKAQHLLGAGALTGAGIGLAKSLNNKETAKSGMGFQKSQTQSLTEFPTSRPNKSKKPKGFFKKTWYKGKSIATAGFTAITSKIPFIQSAKKKQAEELKKIREAVTLRQMVYQSVEAPQIEPLKEQEFQKDPDKPVFTSYDLVRGKSAGVLISINKDKNKKHDIFREFKLQMKIGGHQINTKCLNDWELFPIPAIFQSLRKPQKKQPDPSACFFAMDFLQDYNPLVSLFIELPMSGFLSIAKDDVPIKVDLLDVKSDEIISSVDFKVNVIETRPISIGVVGIKLKCKVNGQMKDLSTNISTIKRFLNSDEVKEYLPYIFPIAEPEKLEDIIEPLKKKHIYKQNLDKFLTSNQFKSLEALQEEDMIFIQGSCNKQEWFADAYTKGIDSIFLLLQTLLERSSKNRLVIVAEEKYMNYHKLREKRIVGFVQKAFEGWKFFSDHSGLQYRIALISGNYVEHSGVLLHELGHTFDQLKEFYEDDSKCQKFNSKKNDRNIKDCNTYQVGRGLKGKIGGSFEWVKDRYGIMNAESDIKEMSLYTYDKWISRETYQKAFAFLKKKSVPKKYKDEWPPGYRLSDFDKKLRGGENFIPGEEIILPVVKISGHYNGKTKQFESLHAQPFQWGNLDNITPSFKKEHINWGIIGSVRYIKVQLKDSKDKVFDEVRLPGSTYLEIFYENKSEIMDLDKTSIFISLSLLGKGFYKVRFSTGVLSIDETGVLKDEEDKDSVQEISFTWTK